MCKLWLGVGLPTWNAQATQHVQVEAFLDAAGSRRVLLVGPDNWSMEDLIDISKASSSEVAKWLDLTCPKATSLATAALLAPK